MENERNTDYIPIEELEVFVESEVENMIPDKYTLSAYTYPDDAVTDETIWDFTKDRWRYETLLEFIREHNYVSAEDCLQAFEQAMWNAYYAERDIDKEFADMYYSAIELCWGLYEILLEGYC